MRKLALTTAAGLLVLALGATPAQAQELSLSILNSGKAVSAPVPVKVVEDGETQTVATASQGATDVTAGIATGTEVTVYVIHCDEGTEVLLVPSGETMPDAEDCDHDKAGVIVWGSDTAVSLDVGTGTMSTGGQVSVNQAPGGTPVSVGYEWKPGFQIGLGAQYFKLTNLEDTGCFNPANCDADDSGLGVNAFLEYDLSSDLPIHIGLGASYKTFGVIEDLGGGDTNQVDVDVLGLSGYAGFHVDLAALARLKANLGASWLHNKANVVSRVDGENFADDRSESGLRLLTSVSLDYRVSDLFGLRAGAQYEVGDEDDADTNFSLGLAAMILMGGDR